MLPLSLYFTGTKSFRIPFGFDLDGRRYELLREERRRELAGL